MKDQDNPPGSQRPGTSLTLWIIIGLAIGTAVGITTHEMALGMGFGLAFGIGLWARLKNATNNSWPDRVEAQSASSRKETL
jgi:hypothetical protein